MSTATFQADGSHFILRGIIRITGALIGLASTLELVFFVPIFAIAGFYRPTPHPWMVLLPIAPIVIFGALALAGYRMFRSINATTVANFAFIFALLVARAWHHFLPVNLPGNISDRIGQDHFLTQGGRPGFGYRGVLAVVAFFIFYFLIKEVLLRLLGLNKVPPKDSSPDGPGSAAPIPEFPQKSPLIEL